MIYPNDFFGRPEISEKSFIFEDAYIVGKVIIEGMVIVASGARLRADEGAPFRICKGSNVQDSVIMHGLLKKFVDVEGEQYSIFIGSHCSLAHGSTIHGPTQIGKKTFVGFSAIVHDSIIGSHCFIGHGARVLGCNIGYNCHLGINSVVKNVNIKPRKYVRDGLVINNQSDADLLPDVPDDVRKADNDFNKEVVDYNKILCERYSHFKMVK